MGNNTIRVLGIPGQIQRSPAFSISDGGEATLVTGSGSGDLISGSASLQWSAGSPLADGFAIIQLRQNNVVVSEVSIAASAPIQAGRIFVETGNSMATGVAIANPNGQPVTLNIVFTDTSGTDYGATSFVIPANGQIAKFVTESPLNSGNSVVSNGSMTFTASLPVAAIALRGWTNERSEFLMTSLPVVALPQSSTAFQVLPHYADGGGWMTQILLLNPSDQTISGTLEFDGRVVQSTPYSIAPRSSSIVKTTDTNSTIDVGFVRVLPSAASVAPAADAIFSFTTNGITVTAAGVPAVHAGNNFRLYAESNGTLGLPGSAQTAVAVVNDGAASAPLGFELTDVDGNIVGTASTVLPAGSHLSMFLSQIPGLISNAAPFEGVLRISDSGSSGIRVLGLLGEYNERGDFLVSTLPSYDESIQPSGPLILPHFVDGGGYSTQFVLMGAAPGQSPAGNLQFLSGSGQSLIINAPFQ
jgi:hypothetical protein